MMHNTKVTIPFEIIPDNDVPIIKFYLDEKPRYAVVDSGAESTLFDVSIKKFLHVVSSEEISIVGVSGESQQSFIDSAEATIWMKGYGKQVGIINVRGYMNNLSHISEHFLGKNGTVSAILGSDMLNHFNAKIDYIKHEVVFSL